MDTSRDDTAGHGWLSRHTNLPHAAANKVMISQNETVVLSRAGLVCGSSLLHFAETEKLWSQGNNFSSCFRLKQNVGLGHVQGG